jgi:hypothetical protein
MGQHLLGVKPTAPGFETALVRPRWAGLEFARGAVPGPTGRFEVAWQRKTGSAATRIELRLPKSEVTAGVPIEAAASRVTCDGREIWDRAHGIAQGTNARMEPDGYLYFRVGDPGAHKIEIA